MVVLAGRPKSTCCNWWPCRRYDWREVYRAPLKEAPRDLDCDLKQQDGLWTSHEVTVEEEDKKLKLLIMRGGKRLAQINARIKEILV